MSKPYDATSKELVERGPADWLRFAGFQLDGPVTIIDSDISTITGAADKVIRVDEPDPWLAHVEFMSGYERKLGLRLVRYSVLVEYRHDLPVHTIVILLRPSSDGSDITGHYQRKLPNGTLYDDFQYQVIRVWQEPLDTFLAGGIATLPLAPLADVPVEQIDNVVQVMEQRMEQDKLDAVSTNLLWTATYIMMGMRYPEEVTNQLLAKVSNMRESTTYQAILAEGEARGRTEGRVEGRVEEVQTLLLKLGTHRFGPAPGNIRVAIEALSDLERLESLSVKVLDVRSWDDLLDP
ncbi:MAG: Rpn family recombination-promoting nuclease/putative transposase [Planctomycetaceae bacterium]